MSCSHHLHCAVPRRRNADVGSSRFHLCGPPLAPLRLIPPIRARRPQPPSPAAGKVRWRRQGRRWRAGGGRRGSSRPVPLERCGGFLLRCAARGGEERRALPGAALSAVAPAAQVRARSRRLPCFGATSPCPGMGWLSGDRDRGGCGLALPLLPAPIPPGLILFPLCAERDASTSQPARVVGLLLLLLGSSCFLAVSARDPARGAHVGAPARPPSAVWVAGTPASPRASGFRARPRPP